MSDSEVRRLDGKTIRGHVVLRWRGQHFSQNTSLVRAIIGAGFSLPMAITVTAEGQSGPYRHTIAVLPDSTTRDGWSFHDEPGDEGAAAYVAVPIRYVFCDAVGQTTEAWADFIESKSAMAN